MKDALVASVATFHMKKIIISDPIKFPHNGSIPESMYRCVTTESHVMADYRKLTPMGPRVLTPEQKAALEFVDKPSNRGKHTTTKKEPTEEDKSKASKSRKRKSDKGDSSKSKKIKKMERRSKSPTPPSSENDKEDEEEESHHESPRGNTPPRSPTPTEPIHNKIPTLPPSPKQTISVSVATIPPITTSSQTTTSLSPPPPVTYIPISTTPLPPPIISQPTTTTIPEPTVGVNVSDTGTTTVTETPFINKPLSPTHSTDTVATLGGENDEYDSTYFSPYRFPTDEDDDTPITSQHLQSINEKLDRLLEDNKAYSARKHSRYSVVLKAFLETTLEQYMESIEKSTKAVDASTSSSKKASTAVTEIVQTTQIFLESLKGHANTNAAKVQASVDSLSKSLQEESTKFEAVRSSIQKENTSLLGSVSSRLESLHADLAKESALKEELACQSTQLEVQKVQLAHAEKEIGLLKTQRVVFCSCAGDVKDMLTNILGAHDPIITLTIRNHLTTKLTPAISMLHEMKETTQQSVQPKVTVKTETTQPEVQVTNKLKDNVASGFGTQEKTTDDSDSDVGETIAEALKRKKRDLELDETPKVAKEAEERERRNKEKKKP
ncbi:uncharacterized protein PB18E9.04c-like [Lactuca sativa]|uniref:uncharacterized protein PB18E9.04c-like n=1 Tax=Lactuca sativa TaxID=4236 RepID=UPI000CD86580|nr:uncharacterized protein PB18E9.04c-like [Lactuca sativa]